MVNRDTNKWSDPYVGALIYQELIYLKNNLQTGINFKSDNQIDCHSILMTKIQVRLYSIVPKQRLRMFLKK